MKPKKPHKHLQGTYPATERAADCILALSRVREQQALLRAAASRLSACIIEEGCGAAHGFRTYVYRVKASHKYCNVKAKDRLIILPYSGACTVPSEQVP